MSKVTSRQLLLIHEARVQLRKRIAESIGLGWDGRFGHDDDVWHEQQSLVQTIAVQRDASVGSYIMALRASYADHKAKILDGQIASKVEVNVTASRHAVSQPPAVSVPVLGVVRNCNPSTPLAASDSAPVVPVGSPRSIASSTGNVSVPKSRVMDILGNIQTK